jgi:hypothetical protein
MIQRYRVLGKVVTGGQDDLQAVLGAAYARKERVLCECRKARRAAALYQPPP